MSHMYKYATMWRCFLKEIELSASLKLAPEIMTQHNVSLLRSFPRLIIGYLLNPSWIISEVWVFVPCHKTYIPKRMILKRNNNFCHPGSRNQEILSSVKHRLIAHSPIKNTWSMGACTKPQDIHRQKILLKRKRKYNTVNRKLSTFGKKQVLVNLNARSGVYMQESTTKLKWINMPPVTSFPPPISQLTTPDLARWRHQMKIFSALLAFCAGNSPATGEFPTQSPVTRSFDVFFDLRLNKQLSKQS